MSEIEDYFGKVKLGLYENLLQDEKEAKQRFRRSEESIRPTFFF